MILARKGDVSIQDESGSSTISAGQQTTRFASNKDSNRNGGGAAPAAGGGISGFTDRCWNWRSGGGSFDHLGTAARWKTLQPIGSVNSRTIEFQRHGFGRA